MESFLREPFVQFVAIGVSIFLLFEFLDGGENRDEHRVVVDQPQLSHITESWAATKLRQPSPHEMDALMDAFIREEIYVREALAMGLDRGDPVIRRRLRQKIEFLVENIVALEPTQQQLESYLASNSDKFRVPPSFSFEQIYLGENANTGGASELATIVNELNEGKVKPGVVGENAPLLPPSLEQLNAGDVAKIFGREFAVALSTLPVGQWQGPIQSGLGQHLVRPTQVIPGRPYDLDEIYDVVRREWQHDQRQSAVDDFYQQLRAKYTVEVVRPNSEPAD